jgi:hypothetical protein
MAVRVGGRTVAVGVTGVGVKVRDAVGVAVTGRVAVAEGIGVGGIGVGVGVGGAPQAIAKVARNAMPSTTRIVRFMNRFSFCRPSRFPKPLGSKY